jgi:hypothetical protein
MKTIAVSTLALAVAAAAGCEGLAPEAPASAEAKVMADDPKPPAAGKDVPPAIAELVKERDKLHKRQTGALLTITAKWVKEPGVVAGIVIDWQIDYDGPRRPFTVLSPYLGYLAISQTALRFWHPDADGKPTGFKLEAEGEGKPPTKRKEHFSISVDGKPVTGRIVVGSSAYLKGHFGGREPKPGDPRLWVQLEHAPTDRGDGYDMIRDPATGFATKGPTWTLDAWTGQLWSQVVEVAPR